MDTDEFVVEFISGVSVCTFVIAVVVGGADWFGNASSSLLFEDVGRGDKFDCSLSRINRIRSRGMIILSLFPWILSICFCRMVQDTNKSLSLTKSSSK